MKKQIVRNKNINEYLKNTNNYLLIYSETSFKKTNINFEIKYKLSTRTITKKTENIKKSIKDIINNVDKIISIGGGTALDIGKYISSEYNKKCIVIPGMLSTNAYSTNKVSLIKKNKKITLDAVLPNEVIIDKDLLNKSSIYNVYGLADIFSIYTALNDWSIASKEINEKIDKKIYEKSKKLLENAIEYVSNNNINYIKNDIDTIYNLIKQSGYITNEYGTGRPESGSEHILAKELERKFKIHHGISVSISIIIMSLFQNRKNNELYKSILKLNIFDETLLNRINRKNLKEILINLSPREDRYSIVNTMNKENNEIDKILDEYKYIIMRSLKDDSN